MESVKHRSVDPNEPQIPDGFTKMVEDATKILQNTRRVFFCFSESRYYQLKDHIGTGCYSNVFKLVKVEKTKEEPRDVIFSVPHTPPSFDIAVKVEVLAKEYNQLRYESEVYRLLRGKCGIPKTFLCTNDKRYTYLVMECLGPSLKDYLPHCGGRFTLKTVLLLADQLLERLQLIHSKGLIYRDVKPENFLTVKDKNTNCTKVCVIDFGLAKPLKEGGVHIGFSKFKKIVGCNTDLLYHSINSLQGCEISRRDDLESLGYLLIHYRTGSLPWKDKGDNALGTTQSMVQQNILKLKKSITPEQLCQGLPMEFAAYMRYCRSLGFTETPDYAYLKQLFRILYRIENYEDDNQFDWNIKWNLLNLQNSSTKQEM